MQYAPDPVRLIGIDTDGTGPEAAAAWAATCGRSMSGDDFTLFCLIRDRRTSYRAAELIKLQTESVRSEVRLDRVYRDELAAQVHRGVPDPRILLPIQRARAGHLARIIAAAAQIRALEAAAGCVWGGGGEGAAGTTPTPAGGLYLSVTRKVSLINETKDLTGATR